MSDTLRTISFSFGKKPEMINLDFIDVLYNASTIRLKKDDDEKNLEMTAPPTLEEGIVLLQFREDYHPLPLFFDGDHFGVLSMRNENELMAITPIRNEEMTVQVYPVDLPTPVGDYGFIRLFAKVEDGVAIGLVIVGTGGID